ncbi:MAG: DUF1599 domain-containing protein [Ignavibacterium sp.]|jgi:hypothetical protein|nr:DUF1599 domain-containing protein [Ignavibacterium sp.]
MEQRTVRQYKDVIENCEKIYSGKMMDYGASWRILRASSLTDQIAIKAKRIRNLQLNETRMIDEGIEGEFQGIVNYSVMAIIQFRKGFSDFPDMDAQASVGLYRAVLNEAMDLMTRKNHDYNEAWRDMRVSSLTDIILMKLFRIKQIENNLGNTSFSEGIDANYFDIINYAIFALILLSETE